MSHDKLKLERPLSAYAVNELCCVHHFYTSRIKVETFRKLWIYFVHLSLQLRDKLNYVLIWSGTLSEQFSLVRFAVAFRPFRSQLSDILWCLLSFGGCCSGLLRTPVSRRHFWEVSGDKRPVLLCSPSTQKSQFILTASLCGEDVRLHKRGTVLQLARSTIWGKINGADRNNIMM